MPCETFRLNRHPSTEHSPYGIPGIVMDEKPRSKFVVCIRNDGADDLEPRKVYQAGE
jgi:hypothetical protein